MKEFTRKQYQKEMVDRANSGMDIPSYALWVNYKKAISKISISYTK